MVAVDIIEGNLVQRPRWIASPVFPDRSVIVGRTPFTLYQIEWSDFLHSCYQACQELGQYQYVFMDATWDPIRPDNTEIVQRLGELQSMLPNSKVAVLTAHAQHWYDNIPGVIYFPFFTMTDYGPIQHQPRRGRFGCLNRRPTLHRIRLMYNALEQNLLDASKDIFSVRFVNLYTNTPYNFESSGYEWMAKELQNWPIEIASHCDGWPCDYTISHPAWHTGIAIITETEPGDRTIICEKTGKGILSKSCFSVYMADVGYKVLEDLGFAPRFFADHAEYDNIEPLLRLMKDIDSETAALDYRQQHMAQIEHNYEWFGIETNDFWQRPWYSRYESKLKAALANL